MRAINYRLHNKLEEVFSIEPNDLGNEKLTLIYHRLTSFLKRMPFIYIVPLSFIMAIILYFIFGTLVVRLASLLQYGF